MLVPPLQPSTPDPQTPSWYASPLTFVPCGLPTFAQNWPAAEQLPLRGLIAPVVGSGPLPKALHGLPIGSGA